MVARLLRLRLTLLAAEFRGSFARAARTALLFLLLIVGAVGLAWLPTLIHADLAERATMDTVVGAVVLAAVFIVPFFENRGHLEPRQFATLPTSPGSIASGLLLSTVLSPPFLLLVVWLVSLGALRPEWREPAWALPLVLIVVALFSVCAARVSSACAKLVIGPDRAGAMRAVGLLLVVAALPVAVFAGATTLNPASDASAADAATVLGWTPFGAAFAGLWMLDSDASGALLRLGILGASVLLLLAVWFPLVRLSNERVERPADPAVARRGLGWFESFAARPAQVIGARSLTYWARDPRYRVALFALPVAPLVILVAFWVAGADPRSLALVPLPVILLLLGWSLHNDVAMDSTAIWVHVASGIRGREDRLGRLAPVALIGVPLVLIGSSLTVTVLGDWRVLPAVVGMNLAVLMISCGVASVFSVLMPYPATRPGDSPFVQPQWSGSGSGTAQTLSMFIAVVLSIPAVWFSAAAILDVEFVPNVWALAFGAGYGALVLVGGVLLGGRIFDRSAPELIAVTQVFD